MGPDLGLAAPQRADDAKGQQLPQRQVQPRARIDVAEAEGGKMADEDLPLPFGGRRVHLADGVPENPGLDGEPLLKAVFFTHRAAFRQGQGHPRRLQGRIGVTQGRLRPREADIGSALVQGLADLFGTHPLMQGGPCLLPYALRRLDGGQDHQRDEAALACIQAALPGYLAIFQAVPDGRQFGVGAGQCRRPRPSLFLPVRLCFPYPVHTLPTLWCHGCAGCPAWKARCPHAREGRPAMRSASRRRSPAVSARSGRSRPGDGPLSCASRDTPPRLPGTDPFLANCCPKLSRYAPRKRGHRAVSPASFPGGKRPRHGSPAFRARPLRYRAPLPGCRTGPGWPR